MGRFVPIILFWLRKELGHLTCVLRVWGSQGVTRSSVLPGELLANGCWTHREYDLYLMKNTCLDVDICSLHAIPF